jgi:hypothetical protein
MTTSDKQRVPNTHDEHGHLLTASGKLVYLFPFNYRADLPEDAPWWLEEMQADIDDAHQERPNLRDRHSVHLVREHGTRNTIGYVEVTCHRTGKPGLLTATIEFGGFPDLVADFPDYIAEAASMVIDDLFGAERKTKCARIAASVVDIPATLWRIDVLRGQLNFLPAGRAREALHSSNDRILDMLHFDLLARDWPNRPPLGTQHATPPHAWPHDWLASQGGTR